MVLSRAMDLGSSRPNAGRVKTDSTWRRLFDGWQVGLAVIVTAALAVLIAVPRPVVPDEIPLPTPNRAALVALSLRDERFASEADRQRLDFDVRALGEAVRAYGKADAAGEREQLAQRLAEVRQLVVPALRQGPEAVLRLRAVQMRIFLDGLDRFERTGQESDDLREVGGASVAMLRRSGWLLADGARVRVLPDRFVREVLFRKRWNEITGLDQAPFAPTLDEDRVFYGFLIEHPVVSVPWVRRHQRVSVAALCIEALSRAL